MVTQKIKMFIHFFGMFGRSGVDGGEDNANLMEYSYYDCMTIGTGPIEGSNENGVT